ncbi:MAG: hypothetical protein OEM39_02425 [Acidimicrobiia bacterium]|nr:hypothetical protein [Acidimicrobiia bacterium]
MAALGSIAGHEELPLAGVGDPEPPPGIGPEEGDAIELLLGIYGQERFQVGLGDLIPGVVIECGRPDVEAGSVLDCCTAKGMPSS